MELLDCIIVGGGPAGLNAAIVLARSRRKILLFDSGTYRNKRSHGMHNYLTRDDIQPHEFISICHQELKKYKVPVVKKTIRAGKKGEDGLFKVDDTDGNLYYSRMLLIATGLMDNIPDIPGFAELYGQSVFHCPYCDGWEVRDKKLAVYARDKNGSELALALKGWSNDVVLLTDGKFKVRPREVEELEANAIPIIRERITAIEGTEGKLQHVLLKTGERIRRDAIFFVNGYKQQCDIPKAFGCEINKKGVVVTNRFQQTNIDGLYVAGDAARDMHFVVVAAAEGAKAGVIINKQLQKQYTKQMVAEKF